MKLNIKKVATFYRVIIGGSSIKFGWYESGRAFIARDNELMTYSWAYINLVPIGVYTLYNYFYVGNTRYDKNMSGIVHYLIDECCK